MRRLNDKSKKFSAHYIEHSWNSINTDGGGGGDGDHGNGDSDDDGSDYVCILGI